MYSSLSGAEEGLVGYWPFDGFYEDVSGNGNHGTPYGDVTFVHPTTPLTNSSYTYSSADVPKTIGPAAGTITESVIEITDGYLISDIDVVVDIEHTYDADITIEITSAGGTTVMLSSFNGGDGDNYQVTTFDDEAATNITNGAAPFNGSYAPVPGPLSLFDGESITGTWTLKITDYLNGDGGTLNGWSLRADQMGVSWIYFNPPTGSIEPNLIDIIVVDFITGTLNPSSYYANILVNSNDSVQPQVVVPTVTTILGYPNLHFSSGDTLDFGKTQLGTHDTLLLTLFNLGYSELQITDITSSDTVFTVDTTVLNIPVGGSEVINVIYSPVIADTNFAQLSFISNDIEKSIVLTGFGMDTPEIIVSTDSLVFADTLFVGLQDTLGFTVVNAGFADLEISGILSNNPVFIIYPGTFTLAPADTQLVNVVFIPDTSAFEAGTLTIQNNDETKYIYAQGIGLLPPVIVLSDTLITETLNAGDSALQTLAITNNGNSDLEYVAIIRDTSEYCVVFDGSGDYIEIGNDISLHVSNITVEVWVYPTSSTSYVDAVAQYGGGSNGWILRTSQNGNGHFTPHVNVGGWHSIDCGVLPLNEWNHISLTYNGETLKGYINGQFVNENQNPSGPLNPTGINTIGSAYQIEYFQGYIDEVRIWDYARTEQEIQSSMNSPLLGIENGLKGYWNFNGSDPWLDYSGNGNNGQPFGDVLVEISDLNISPSWIDIISNASGTISPSNNVDVDMQFNAFNIIGGNYEANLQINNNDPFDPEVDIPLYLTVVGTPTYELTPDSLNFGTIYFGELADLDFTVTNTGTDSLFVTGINTGNSDFTASPDNFKVAVDSSQLVTVTYLPSATGADLGEIIQISNAATSDTVTLTGNAIAPPVISVTPDSLADTLLIGDQTFHQLTISNVGFSDLEYNIIVDFEPAYLYIDNYSSLAKNKYDYKNDPSKDSFVIDTLIIENFDNFPPIGWYTEGANNGNNWQSSSSNNAGGTVPEAEFYWSPSTLGQQRLVTTPINTVEIDTLTLSFKQYVDDYSGGGYTLGVATTSDGSNWIDDWTLQPTGNIGPESLEFNINTSDVGSENFQLCFYFDGNSYDINYWYIDNVLLIGKQNISINWINIAPEYGVVQSNQDTTITVNLDATYLSTDVHTAEIIIQSNDISNDEVIVPVSLTVNPGAGIVVADTFRVDNINVDSTEIAALVIRNVGTQTLNITNIILTDANSVFGISGTSFTIPAEDQDTLWITFTPNSLQWFDAALQIFSNDPTDPVYDVVLLGNGISDPVIDVSPVSFNVIVPQNDSISEILTITNNGGSDLEYQLHSLDSLGAGLAAKFDGSGDYITISPFPFSFYEYTISFWIYPELAGSGNRQGIINFNNGITDLRTFINPSAIEHDISSGEIGNINTPFNINEWAYISITFDNTYVKIYNNGILMDQAAADMTFLNVQTVQISWLAVDKYLKGLIDEVSIYNYALSSEEILSSMFRNKSANEVGLLGYWNFNNDNPWEDLSGNGNNGTAFGNTTVIESTAPINSLITFDPLSGIVPRFTTQEVEVKFYANNLDFDDYNTNIQVISNDMIQDTLLIPVAVTVPPPVIEVVPTLFDFTLYSGDVIDTNFTVSNYGISDLIFFISNNYEDGMAAGFDGIGNYIEIPDDNSLDITNAITIEAWIKPDLVETIENIKNKEPKAYCPASGGCDEFIQQMILGEINNSSSCDGYADYTSMSTILNVGETYDITVVNGNVYSTDDLGVWIDWNQNDDFEDAGENVVCEIDNSGQGTFSFVVPDGALPGETTMRVRIKYSGSDCGDPCGSTTYGEVEDYSIYINSIYINSIILTFESLGDTLDYMDSRQIFFNIETIGVPSYNPEIIILSNDPNEDSLFIPINLNVQSAPGVHIESDTVVFGEQFLYNQVSSPFTISNRGSDTLEIFVLPISSDVFSFTGNSSTSILPGNDENYTIWFSPNTIQTEIDTLVISTNDPTDTIVKIYLFGIGIAGPEISLNPNPLEVTAITANSINEDFIIYNNGGSDLMIDFYLRTKSNLLKWPYAYVVNYSSNSFSIINLESHTVTNKTGLFSEPYCIDMSRNGEHLWITYTNANRISIYNLPTNVHKSITTAGTDHRGTAFSPNGKLAYVADLTNNRIEVFNTQTFELINTFGINIDNPQWLDVSADGKILYISDSGTDKVIVVDTESGNEIKTLSGFIDPWGIELSPNGNWFAFRDGDNVKIGSAETNSIIYNIPNINTPRIPVWSPDNEYLYVGSWNDYKIHKIETISFNEVQVIDLIYKPWSIHLSEDNLYLVAACANDDKVAIMDLQTDEIDYVTVQDYPATITTFRTKQPYWIQNISDSNDTIEIGTSKNVDVSFNTTGIQGGDYQAEIHFKTNDPLAKEFNYDIILHHNTGEPYLYVEFDTLNFGNVWIGYPDTLTIDIHNTGTETLNITSIQCNPPVFYTLESQLIIDPNSDYSLDVHCEANSMGTINGNLLINSNGGNRTVLLEANAYSPPVAIINPSSISTTIPPDTMGQEILTLNNNGTSDLSYYSTIGLHRDKYFIGNNSHYGMMVWNASTNATQLINLLFSGPWKSKYSPDGKYLWVTFEDFGYIVVINANTNIVEEYIMVGGSRTSGITFNKTGNYAYIGNWTQNRIEIINTIDFMWEGSITGTQFSNPKDLICETDAAKLYVINNGNDDLVLIDLNTNTVIQSIDGYGIGYDLVLSKDGSYLYWIDDEYVNKVST